MQSEGEPSGAAAVLAEVIPHDTMASVAAANAGEGIQEMVYSPSVNVGTPSSGALPSGGSLARVALLTTGGNSAAGCLLPDHPCIVCLGHVIVTDM